MKDQEQQEPAPGESECHNDQRRDGLGGVLSGGEVQPPEDGGEDQRDLRQRRRPVLALGHDPGVYRPGTTVTRPGSPPGPAPISTLVRVKPARKLVTDNLDNLGYLERSVL